MKKIILLTVAVAMFIALPLGSVFAYEALVGPTGVLQYDSTKAYNGYTQFSSNTGGCTNAYLIDMEGYIVHSWETDYTAGLHDTLLENGHLLRGANLRGTPRQQQPFSVGGGHSGLVQEFDWDGTVVWWYELNTPTSVQHHTFTRHPTNGNTLILAWEYKSYDEAVTEGRLPGTLDTVQGIWPDYVIEVNQAKQVVWEYHVWDHLGTGPMEYDINWVCPGTRTRDWTHWNTANYHPTEDQIITNSRHFGESYVIDRATGDMLYRWGNPSAYDGTAEAPSFMDDGDQLLWGPHHAHVIDTGLPGAGHLLILDNGWNRPRGNRTRSVEVDMTTGDIVWQYASLKANSLYSSSQCSNQRLPNGNTVITSTVNGHIVEVDYGDPTGIDPVTGAKAKVAPTVVWEFINPITAVRVTVDDVATYPTYPDVRCVWYDQTPNSIHRSTRYGPDFPGLAGKDLSRKGLLAEGCPEFWKMLNEERTGWVAEEITPQPIPITGWGIPPGTTSEAGAGAAAGEGGEGGY